MAAADDFKILDEAVKAGKRSVTLPDGRTFTLTQARDERDRLGEEIKKTKTAKTSEESSKEAEITNAEKLVRLSETKLAAQLRAFNKGNATESSVVRVQQELQTRQEGLARLTSATAVTAPATAATTTATTKPAEMGPKLSEIPGGFKYPDTTGTGDVVDTGSGGGGAVKPGKPGKPGKDTKPVDTSWEPLFKQNYPQYNWMFTDLDRTKYADVFDLFKRAQQNKMLPQELDRQYIGTSFYRELQSSKKGRELSAAIGNFTWSSGNLAKFLTKATQYGYEGENLKQQAYKELFTKVGGKYVNDLAVGEVKASSPYLALKRIGTQFLSPATDETVEAALTGGSSPDDVLRLAREKAKVMYPHLAKSIDAGLSLEELASDYKQVAARTLELDPSQIDMGGIYNVAIKSGEGGKERMLSTSEWETLLRTDSKFKYSFTKQANQDATNIGLSIARAFGKVG